MNETFSYVPLTIHFPDLFSMPDLYPENLDWLWNRYLVKFLETPEVVACVRTVVLSVWGNCKDLVTKDYLVCNLTLVVGALTTVYFH